MSKFSFGTDPEFMLSRNGKKFSAIGIVPGSKKNRHRIGNAFYYYDNILAECAVQPSDTRDEAVATIRNALHSYAGLVRPYALEATASHKFDTDQLTHPEAMKIGCDPESCAYDLVVIEPQTDNIRSTTMRTAGGHIHLGYDFAKSDFGCLHTIRMMDLFVGIPSVFLDKDPTTMARKQMYGQAGRFRKPPHGAEYRTIGNFWLSSPQLVELIYDLSSFVVDFTVAGRHEKHWVIDTDRLNDDDAWAEDGFDPASCHKSKTYDVKKLRKSIDKMDQKTAKTFMPILKKEMPAMLFSRLERAIENARHYNLMSEWGIRNG